MRREFFILANVNETQRSSATLSGMSGRQKGKFAAQADGAAESGNSIKRIRTKDRNGQRRWRKFAGKPFIYRRIHGMIMKGKRRAVRMARIA